MNFLCNKKHFRTYIYICFINKYKNILRQNRRVNSTVKVQHQCVLFYWILGHGAITRVMQYYIALSFALMCPHQILVFTCWRYLLVLRPRWALWPAISFLHHRLSQPLERSSAPRACQVWRTRTSGHLCCGHSFQHSDELDHEWDGAVPAPVGRRQKWRLNQVRLQRYFYDLPIL